MKPIELTERLGRWSSGRGPLYVLLAARLRRLIDDGELPPGEPLPPDRALAAALAVGRSTAVAAYDLLRQDGRIIRRQGSGTRVAGAGPRGPRPTTSAPMFLHMLEPGHDVIRLTTAAPDMPPPEVAQAYAHVAAVLARAAGDAGYYPAGHPALRDAIADRYTQRGIRTSPDQIVVTTGAQQALSLLARALLTPGDRVLVEAPTYSGALEAFREHAAVPCPLPVGLAGLAAAVAEQRAAMAYVISTFHNPTGSVLPLLARQTLARTAAAAGVALVDDEVLSDLAFPGVQVPPPLAACAGTVISVGSLSKSIWGGLRTGWIRAPQLLTTRLARLLAVHDLGGNVPAQLAAAQLLPRLDAITQRQAAERQARHDHLRAALARHLPDWNAPPVSGGHTLWVRLPHGDGTSFAQTALRHHVAVLPGTGLDATGQSHDHLRLHFAAPPDTLTQATLRLGQAWRAYHPPPAPATTPPAISVLPGGLVPV
jgi:DNA-binding transcriptional MocR family regulator